ncbi:hypothetical protein Tco_0190656 [Tanacetum coccineum]
MHISKDDYLINTLRFVFAKEATQIYGAILPKSLTSHEMKEIKAYKTFLGFATGATPPKKARKETPKMSLSKKKEKITVEKTVEKRKGIDLLSEVALNEEAQYKEVRKKRTGVKQGVPDVTEEESSESEAREIMKMIAIMIMTQVEKTMIKRMTVLMTKPNQTMKMRDDEEEVKDEFVKTPSNDSDKEDETKIIDKAEGDEDEKMDYTTSQLYDDVDIRLNKPVQADDETVQKEGTDAELTNIQQGNENPKITQVIEDAHVTLSTVLQKAEVPVTSYSHSSDLASKFLKFSNIPYTDAEIVSPMDVHIHHEVPSQQTPTLLTVHVSVIMNSSPVYSTVIPQSLPSFIPPPQQSTSTPLPTTKVTNP